MGGVGGISGDFIVVVDPNAQPLQPGLEGLGQRLPVIPGQHHTGYIQPEAPKHVDQPDHVPVIGNPQIPPNLVLFDVVGVDGDDHLHLIFQLQEHPQLAVRLETGEHPGSVVVVVELAAEFQIQFAAKLSNPLPDVLGLHL